MSDDTHRVFYLEERRDAILASLENDGVVRIDDLSERFQVSSATVRKDIRFLEQQGLLRRTHGGAIRPQSNLEMEFEAAAVSNHDEKVRIGRAAASLVNDGDIFLVQAGTTCREFVNSLAGRHNLTLFVSDFEIAMAAERLLPDSKIIFIGGLVRSGYHYTRGTEAVRQLNGYCIPTAFMCTNAFNFKNEFSTHQLEQANWLQAQMECSSKRIMMLDSSKFEIDAPFGALRLADIDLLVTDNAMKPELRQKLSKLSPELEIMFV